MLTVKGQEVYDMPLAPDTSEGLSFFRHPGKRGRFDAVYTEIIISPDPVRINMCQSFNRKTSFSAYFFFLASMT